jgi:hypothetical protein
MANQLLVYNPGGHIYESVELSTSLPSSSQRLLIAGFFVPLFLRFYDPIDRLGGALSCERTSRQFIASRMTKYCYRQRLPRINFVPGFY